MGQACQPTDTRRAPDRQSIAANARHDAQQCNDAQQQPVPVRSSSLTRHFFLLLGFGVGLVVLSQTRPMFDPHQGERSSATLVLNTLR